MAKNKLPFIFDIETGGKSAYQSSILSLSYLDPSTEKVESVYARPEVGSRMYSWPEKNVWQPIQKMKPRFHTEQELLGKFIGRLKQLEPGTEVAGWNIGYNVAPQSQPQTGFDLPFLMTRAQRYGMEKEFQAAMAPLKIRDLGQEFALDVANMAVRNANLVDEKLLESAKGYLKYARGFGYDPEDIQGTARFLGRSNRWMTGWKQELAYGLLTGKEYAAHISAEDVGALKELYGAKSKLSEAEFVAEWNKKALANKAATVTAAAEAAPETYRRWTGLSSKAKSSLLDDTFIAVKQHVTEHLPAYKKIGITAGVIGGLYALQPGSWFSGKDDEYNVIEGLRHGGMAQQMRRDLTDFGSGWQRTSKRVLNRIRWFPKRRPLYTAVGLGLGGIAAINTIRDMLPEDTFQERARERLGESVDWDKETRYYGLRDSYETKVKKRFQYFTKSLESYGQEVGTGHKRLLIPKTALNREQIEDVLNFTPVSIAIPEAGQKQFSSYRHTSNLYHLHEHDDAWSLHKDEHAALTMSLKSQKHQEKSGLSKVYSTASNVIKGFTHTIGEGIPGAFYYLKGRLTFSDEMDTRLYNELPSRYLAQAARMKPIISGKDDDYNTIEGLRHGGMAQKLRKELTDFGSGWIRKALSKASNLGSQKNIGFSKDKIRQLAEQSRSKSLKEFSKSLKVEISDNPVLELGGGGINIAPKSSFAWFEKYRGMSADSMRSQATSLGVRHGQAYITESPFESLLSSMKRDNKAFIDEIRGLKSIAKEQNTTPKKLLQNNPELNTIIGQFRSRFKTIKAARQYSTETKENIGKTVAFHEATELANVTAVTNRDLLIENAHLEDNVFQHTLTLPQEEFFLRHLKDKKAYSFFKSLRIREFSGFDDQYNTIEGLRHGGLSQHMRKILTDFGSGWDALRGLMRADETFETMLSSSTFKKALSEAVQVKKIGQGAYGAVYQMRGQFRGQTFQFARKTAVAGQSLGHKELNIMRDLQTKNYRYSPSVYGHQEVGGKVSQIDLELFEGTALEKLGLDESFQRYQNIKQALSDLHEKGVEHMDPHLGNLMVVNTPSGQEIGVIDYGFARGLADVPMGERSAFGKYDQAFFDEFLMAKSQDMSFEKAYGMAAKKGISEANKYASASVDDNIDDMFGDFGEWGGGAASPTKTTSVDDAFDDMFGDFETTTTVGSMPPSTITKSKPNRSQEMAKAQLETMQTLFHNAHNGGKGHLKPTGK